MRTPQWYWIAPNVRCNGYPKYTKQCTPSKEGYECWKVLIDVEYSHNFIFYEDEAYDLVRNTSFHDSMVGYSYFCVPGYSGKWLIKNVSTSFDSAYTLSFDASLVDMVGCTPSQESFNPKNKIFTYMG